MKRFLKYIVAFKNIHRDNWYLYISVVPVLSVLMVIIDICMMAFIASIASGNKENSLIFLELPSSLSFGIILIFIRLIISEVLAKIQHFLAASTNIKAMQAFLDRNYDLEIEKKLWKPCRSSKKSF